VSITYTETMTVVQCCNCGVTFGFAAGFERARREDKKSFYCPNGHQQGYYGKSAIEKERDRLKAQAERLERQLANTDEDLRSTRASLTATKGVLTKTKKRVANGVCPCCNRSFADLGRHMAGQHPEYAEASK
jgi:hypothetical protein